MHLSRCNRVWAQLTPQPSKHCIDHQAATDANFCQQPYTFSRLVSLFFFPVTSSLMSYKHQKHKLQTQYQYVQHQMNQEKYVLQKVLEELQS